MPYRLLVLELPVRWRIFCGCKIPKYDKQCRREETKKTSQKSVDIVGHVRKIAGFCIESESFPSFPIYYGAGPRWNRYLLQLKCGPLLVMQLSSIETPDMDHVVHIFTALQVSRFGIVFLAEITCIFYVYIFGFGVGNI